MRCFQKQAFFFIFWPKLLCMFGVWSNKSCTTQFSTESLTQTTLETLTLSTKQFTCKRKLETYCYMTHICKFNRYTWHFFRYFCNFIQVTIYLISCLVSFTLSLYGKGVANKRKKKNASQEHFFFILYLKKTPL